MNERIKQLEKQCWRSTQSDPYAFFDVKKFAELIVKECIAQCEKNADHQYLGAGSKLSAFNIKEHFGVEE
jgi:hypothetical protein